jgi:hypothetical protein
MGERLKIPWWQWLPVHKWRIIGAVESADEVPEHLPRNAVALVGSLEYPKWLVFDCPCRGGHRIMLNADKARRPCWALGALHPLTIIPSIDYKAPDAKRCHYLVRKGQVTWIKF